MPILDPWSAQRQVGGDLLDEIVHSSESARLEVLHRHTPGVMTWEFEQPALALFWFSSGFSRARLRIDGEAVDVPISRRASLGVIAANSHITGEFDTDSFCDYTVAFLDGRLLAGARGSTRSVLTFEDTWMSNGFAELRRYAVNDDPMFSLMLEGWSMQVAARMASSTHEQSARSAPLASARLRRVISYIETTPATEMTPADMAGEAGYSVRHFTRAFIAATGTTPMRYVMQSRVRRAKELLAGGEFAITDVAYMCGFSHPQHMANTFRQHVGISPSEFARLTRP